MNLVYVGKIANTHGLKGEIRILSTFYVPDSVFSLGNELIINDTSYVIKSYRKHKNFDMVMFEGIDSIDDVLSLKGLDVYIKRSSVKEKLLTDYIGMNVLYKDKKGEVINLVEGVKYPYFEILMNLKKYLVPILDNFYTEEDNLIKIVEMDGLFDEN